MVSGAVEEAGLFLFSKSSDLPCGQRSRKLFCNNQILQLALFFIYTTPPATMSAEQAAKVEEIPAATQEEEQAAPAPAAAATGSYVCHCGKTGYKIKAAPKMAAYCHCITCRQYGGVANVAVYNDADVEYTETTKENLIDYKSAENKWRRHCKNCGCWVNNWSPAMGFIAPLLGIKWNDDGVIPHPQFHIWTGEKGESQIHDDLTQFEGWPQ